MRVKSKNKLIVVLTCLMAFFVAFACFTMLTTSEAKATTNGMTFDEKVQIRTVPNSYGIRFALNIDQETYNTVSLDDDAEIGAIIIPAFVYQNASALEGDLINNILTLYPKNTKDGITAKVDLALLTETDGVYTAGCSLTNVKDVNLKYDYQAVGYYTLDGVNYVYGQASESESMADVAYAYLTSPDFSEEDEGPEGKGILTSYIAKTAAQKVNGSVAGVVIDEETGEASLEVKVEKDLGQSVDLSGLDVAIESSNESIQVENGIITLKGKKAINENLVVALANGAIKYNISIVGVPVVEADVKDGLDLSVLLPEGVEIDTVKLGETDKIVSDGKVSFEATETSLDEQVVIVTDVNGVEYKIKVTVWSLLIDSEEELTQMNQYQYQTGVAGDKRTVGFYKLLSDITLTEPWSKDYAVGIGDYQGGSHGFQGVFDGNNKKISNFTLPHQASTVRAAMFYVLGEKSIIRNLKIDATSSASHGGIGYTSGVLAYTTAGGTIENVEITLSITGTVYAASTYVLSSSVLGEIFVSTNNKQVVLNNVKIIAKDATMATNATANVLGYISNKDVINTKELIELNNVTIAGFGNIMYDNDGENAQTKISTLAQLQNIATCNNVQVYSTLADYNESLYIKLNAVDVDVKDGFDVNAVLPENVSAVTVSCNGNNVALTDGKISYTATDASDQARNYIITATDGNIYTISATVWSLLIDGEEELKAMKQYANITTLSGAQKTWGYYKLVDDITMMSDWGADYVVGKGDYIGGDHCFSGIFDGNGKTISNFVIPNAVDHVSMFYSVGKDFVMKDVKIEAENKTTGGYNSAIIAEYISGGTFENIEITLKLPEVYIYANIITIGGGGLFEYFGSTASNYDITLNNVKVIAASNDMETVNCAPLGIIHGSNANQNAEALKSKIKLNGVVFAGFKNVMFDVVTPICTLEQLKTITTCDANVQVYATLADYQATLA